MYAWAHEETHKIIVLRKTLDECLRAGLRSPLLPSTADFFPALIQGPITFLSSGSYASKIDFVEVEAVCELVRAMSSPTMGDVIQRYQNLLLKEEDR